MSWGCTDGYFGHNDVAPRFYSVFGWCPLYLYGTLLLPSHLRKIGLISQTAYMAIKKNAVGTTSSALEEIVIKDLEKTPYRHKNIITFW